MGYIILNAWPILAATLAASLATFGWLRLVRGPGAPHPGAGLVALMILANAWIAAILAGALILAPVEAGVWTVALGSAALIWAGFVLPVVVAGGRARGQAWRSVTLDAGHWLLAMLVMAATLRLVGVTPP